MDLEYGNLTITIQLIYCNDITDYYLFFISKVTIIPERLHYLKHLSLWTLVEEQVLLVQRLQGLSCNLGFLFGFTCSVFQQVHLNVGSCPEGRTGGRDKVKQRKEGYLESTGS